jgi:ribose transport system permease protein
LKTQEEKTGQSESDQPEGTKADLQARRYSSIRRLFPIFLLAALIALFGLASPRFLTLNNFFIVLQQTVVLLVVAVGMTFVIISGSIDLSVGSMTALAAMVAAASSSAISVAAIVPAVLIGLAAGLLNGILFAVGKIPSFMVTLGTLVAYRGIVLYVMRGAPISISDASYLDVYNGRLFGVPNSALIAAVIVVLASLLFSNLVYGREVRAIGGRERVAILTGIRVDRVKIITFTLLGGLCGLAGVLQSARAFGATAQLGDGLELDVIAAVVVGGTPLTGGIGSIQGTILGAFITTVLSNGMNMLGVDAYLQSLARGVVLIVAVFVTIDRSKIGIIK